MDRIDVPQAEAERIRKLRGLGRYTADEAFAQRLAAFVRTSARPCADHCARFIRKRAQPCLA